MEDYGNVRRQPLEDLMAAEAAVLEASRRHELQRELAEIDSRAGASVLTLQEHQTAITEQRATIQRCRAIIEASESTIRAISNESETLRRQDGINMNRREEIQRNLDPQTLRNHCQRKVKEDYFLYLRSGSLDLAAQTTTTRAVAAGSSNQVHQINVENATEEPEPSDEAHEGQRVRRSSRKRHARRYYNEFRLSPPDGDTQDQELDEEPHDGGQRKRARRSGGEPNTRAKKGKKKRRATGTSRIVGPADAREPIEFDEVYAGGNAKIKYNIAEYPKGSNKWYILRCPQHNKHFFRGALQGGFKHLSGKSHGLSRSQELAFDMLSVRVLNCDAEKAELNNIAVRMAVEAGYKTPRLDGKHRERSTTITVGSKSSRRSRFSRQSEISNSIGSPIVGQIYQLMWLEEPAVAVVLPMGDLSCVGMTGDAVTEIGLKLPSCYTRWKSDGSYRWKGCYRDGGSRVDFRKYPVMAFLESMVIPPYPEPFSLPLGRECYDFPMASQLSTIDLDDPVHQDVKGIEQAKAFRTRIAAWRERTNQQNTGGGENTATNGEVSDVVNSGAAGDNINGNVDNIGDDRNDDDVRGDTHAESDSDSESDSDTYTDSENDSEDGHATIDGDTFTGVDRGEVVQANVADASNMQQEEEGTQAGGQADPSCSAMASSEASGAPSMTTAELTDYLSDLHRNLGFGQDHVSANKASGPRGVDVTMNSHDGVNGPRWQPDPVKHEPVLGSWSTSAGGSHSYQTARQDEAHGLPYVEHIDLTCPDSSSDDDHTGTDSVGQEATSASQPKSPSPPRVKPTPFEPPPSPWHTVRGGFTSFGARTGSSETISFRHPPFRSFSRTSSDTGARPHSS